MYIRYKLYRADMTTMFNAEMIEFVIENDDHLAMIDKILQDLLTQHIQSLEEVKKYGIAYVGKMEIVNIEITDKDNINLTEEAFRHYMSTIMPYLQIIWSQQVSNIDEEKTEFKIENKEN